MVALAIAMVHEVYLGQRCIRNGKDACAMVVPRRGSRVDVIFGNYPC